MLRKLSLLEKYIGSIKQLDKKLWESIINNLLCFNY